MIGEQFVADPAGENGGPRDHEPADLTVVQVGQIRDRVPAGTTVIVRVHPAE